MNISTRIKFQEMDVMLNAYSESIYVEMLRYIHDIYTGNDEMRSGFTFFILFAFQC